MSPEQSGGVLVCRSGAMANLTHFSLYTRAHDTQRLQHAQMPTLSYFIKIWEFFFLRNQNIYDIFGLCHKKNSSLLESKRGRQSQQLETWGSEDIGMFWGFGVSSSLSDWTKLIGAKWGWTFCQENHLFNTTLKGIVLPAGSSLRPHQCKDKEKYI